MKKFLILFLCVLLSFGAIGLIGCEKDDSVSTEEVSATSSVSLSFGESILRSGAVNGEESLFVSKTVRATISPSSVADQYVTWSLAWASDAALKDSDISEYLEITSESQGELLATINCYKAFRGSKAILTCTTRQGNRTATCEVVYEGIPSSMTLTPTAQMTQYNIGNENLDMLYVGNSYQLSVAVDNIFHDAGTSFNDYVVSVSGVGTVTCHDFQSSPRGGGWRYGYEDNGDPVTDHVIDFNTIASDFVNVSVSNNIVTIQVDKSFYEYYESIGTQQVEMVGTVTTFYNKLRSLNVDSDGNLPYFVLTVSHRTLGFSAQYMFFIGEEVSNVSMNAQTITF